MTQVHNPFNFLRNVSSLLKECGDGTGQCTCTDPSYKYSKPCKITKQTGDNTRCYFGQPSSNTGIIKSTSNYSFLPKDSVSRVNTKNAGKQPFTQANTGGNTPLTSSYDLYPKSLLFCNDPEGNAYPNPSQPNITYNNNQFNDWNTQQNVVKKQSNLGFD